MGDLARKLNRSLRVARKVIDGRNRALQKRKAQPMVTVELSPAYSWDCPECGRENFQRAISQVLDPQDEDDAEVIRGMHDLDPGEAIPDTLQCSVQSRPERVTCRHCGAEFKAADTHSRELPDDD